MDSAPVGATRMGSRSSTRHGGPTQVFEGPVRKWRKVWSPVTSSAPSISTTRVVLYKWNPLTAPDGGLREDSGSPEETIAVPDKPAKYLPVSVVMQRNKGGLAMDVVEKAEAQLQTEDQHEEGLEKASEVAVSVKDPDSPANQEMTEVPSPTTG